MNARELERMSLDELWSLHERIVAILNGKLVQETRKLEEKLNGLGRKFGRSPADPPQRRPYPKVEPKFEHPKDPGKTWSGRGRQPRWVVEVLASGLTLEHCRISAAS